MKMKSENEVSVIESSLDGVRRGLMLVLVMLFVSAHRPHANSIPKILRKREQRENILD